MGQDKKYSEEQRLFALRTVQKFRDRWEVLERENLERDVSEKIDRADVDQAYIANYRELDASELDRIVEDAMRNAVPPEDAEEAGITEDQKALVGIKARFLRATTAFYAPNQAAQHKAKMDRMNKEKLRSAGGDRSKSGLSQADQQSQKDDAASQISKKDYVPLAPEQWKDKLKDFARHSVVKYPRIWQSLMYLLKSQERSHICERDTNKLSWKKTKELLRDDKIFQAMSEYWPFGPKDESYREYEKLAFIKENIKDYSPDAVDGYSVAVGALLRWVLLAVETRTDDIRIRRAQIASSK